MIVVTTPTGHIGSQVVKHLLDAGEKVRVVVRDPYKLPQGILHRVDIVQGSHGDEGILSRALEGAESLFWVVPPSFPSSDPAGYYLDFARIASRASVSRGVKRVVGVSALGRRSPLESGLVGITLACDAEFESTGVNYRALWCPSFMENALMQLEPLKQQGAFFLPEQPGLKSPRAATRDIAASGAKLLLDRSWTGQGGLAVLGPEDLSNDDLAAIMTDVLGAPIRFQHVPSDAYKARLMGHGASEAFAQALVAMHEAKSNGLDNTEPRNPENTTPTSFRQWCEEVLKPAFLA
ncbi:NAD(P)H-binding protein [soil metagenome]